MSSDDSGSEAGIENVWFSKASSFARFVGQKLPVAIDGLADAIKRSAFNIIAELDELERQSVMTEILTDSENVNYVEPITSSSRKVSNSDREKFSRLPWEILFEEKSLIFRYDEELKAKILALSLDMNNFLTPFSCENKIEHNEKTAFYDSDAKALLIQQIFHHDQNLLTMYSKVIGALHVDDKCLVVPYRLSPSITDQNLVDDKTFWKNYFFHCNQLREVRRNELSGYDDELDAEIIQNPDSSCIDAILPPHENGLLVRDSIQDEYVIIKACS